MTRTIAGFPDGGIICMAPKALEARFPGILALNGRVRSQAKVRTASGPNRQANKAAAARQSALVKAEIECLQTRAALARRAEYLLVQSLSRGGR